MNERANIPHSERFRLAAEDWVEKDAAARLLEETKTAVLAQRIQAEGDKAYNKAERDVKASRAWHDYLKKMVDAKTASNKAKMRLEFLRMEYFEYQGKEATARSERRF